MKKLLSLSTVFVLSACGAEKLPDKEPDLTYDLTKIEAVDTFNNYVSDPKNDFRDLLDFDKAKEFLKKDVNHIHPSLFSNTFLLTKCLDNTPKCESELNSSWINTKFLATDEETHAIYRIPDKTGTHSMEQTIISHHEDGFKYYENFMEKGSINETTPLLMNDINYAKAEYNKMVSGLTTDVWNSIWNTRVTNKVLKTTKYTRPLPAGQTRDVTLTHYEAKDGKEIVFSSETNWSDIFCGVKLAFKHDNNWYKLWILR